MIHAGLYYPAGSLKAQLCIEGASRLYSFCASHAVPADRCGKLVVATSPEEIAELDELRARAAANGVEGAEVVDRRFARAHEPCVEALAALWSANTGRVTPSALVRALLRRRKKRGRFLPKGDYRRSTQKSPSSQFGRENVRAGQRKPAAVADESRNARANVTLSGRGNTQ